MMSKYFIISALEAEPYKKQMRYSWFFAIQAIELENGTFALRKEVVEKAGLKFGEKSITVNDKECELSVEIEKYPLMDEKDIIFKVEAEQIIKEKI